MLKERKLEKMPGLPAIHLPSPQTSLSTRDLAAILTEVPPKVPLPPDIKLPPGVPFPPLPPPIPPSKRAERYDERDLRRPYDEQLQQNERWSQEPRDTNQFSPNQNRNVQDPRAQQQQHQQHNQHHQQHNQQHQQHNQQQHQQHNQQHLQYNQQHQQQHQQHPQQHNQQHQQQLPPFSDVDQQNNRNENHSRQEFPRPSNVFGENNSKMRYDEDNNTQLSWREQQQHRQQSDHLQNTGPSQPPRFMDDRNFRPEAPNHFHGPPPRPPGQQFHDPRMPRGPRGPHGAPEPIGQPREPGHFDHRQQSFNQFQDHQRFPSGHPSNMNQGPPRHFDQQRPRFPPTNLNNEYRPRNQGGNVRFPPPPGSGPHPRFGPRGGNQVRPNFGHHVRPVGEMQRPPFNMNENRFQRPPIRHTSEQQQQPFSNAQQPPSGPPLASFQINQGNRSAPPPHSVAGVPNANEQNNLKQESQNNNRTREPERRNRSRGSGSGEHQHHQRRYDNQRKRRHEDDFRDSDANDPWGRSRKWHDEKRKSKPKDLEDGELPS